MYEHSIPEKVFTLCEKILFQRNILFFKQPQHSFIHNLDPMHVKFGGEMLKFPCR